MTFRNYMIQQIVKNTFCAMQKKRVDQSCTELFPYFQIDRKRQSCPERFPYLQIDRKRLRTSFLNVFSLIQIHVKMLKIPVRNVAPFSDL